MSTRSSQEPSAKNGLQDGASAAGEAELEPFSQAVLLSVRSKSNPSRGTHLTLPRESWTYVPPGDLKALAPEGALAPVVLPTEVERVIAIEVTTDPASMPPALARQASLNKRSPESRPPSRLRRLTSALDASDADSSPGPTPRRRTHSPPPFGSAKERMAPAAAASAASAPLPGALEAPTLLPPPVIESLVRSHSTPDVNVLAFESRTERLLNQHRRLEEQHGTAVTLPVLVPAALESGTASSQLRRSRTPSQPQLRSIPSAKVMDLNPKVRKLSAPAPPIQEVVPPKPAGFLRRALACFLPQAPENRKAAPAAAAAAEESAAEARGLQLREAGRGLSTAELLRKSITLLSASSTPRSTAGLSDDLLSTEEAAPADSVQLPAGPSMQTGGRESAARETLDSRPSSGQGGSAGSQQQAAQPDTSGAAKKAAPHLREKSERRRYGDSPKRGAAAGAKPAAKQHGQPAIAKAAVHAEEVAHSKAQAAAGGCAGQPGVRFGEEAAASAEQQPRAAADAPAAEGSSEAALLQELEALTAQAKAKHEAALAAVQEYERGQAATPQKDRWWALAEAALDSRSKDPWRLAYFDRSGPGTPRRAAPPQPKSPRQLTRERKMLANRKPLYQPPRRVELEAAPPKPAPASPKRKGGRRQEAPKHASLFSVPTELARVQGSESERSPSAAASRCDSSQRSDLVAEGGQAEQTVANSAPSAASLHKQLPAEELRSEPAPASQGSGMPSPPAVSAADDASLPATAAPASSPALEQPPAKSGASRKLSGFWGASGSATAKRPSIWRPGNLFRTMPATSAGTGGEEGLASGTSAAGGQLSATVPRSAVGNMS